MLEVWMGPIPVFPIGIFGNKRERLFVKVGSDVVRFRVENGPGVDQDESYRVHWQWIDQEPWTMHYSIRRHPAEASKGVIRTFYRGPQVGVYSWKSSGRNSERIVMGRRRCTARGSTLEHLDPKTREVISRHYGMRWRYLGGLDQSDAKQIDRFSLMCADIVSMAIPASSNIASGA
jgi:hypothetical protein